MPALQLIRKSARLVALVALIGLLNLSSGAFAADWILPGPNPGSWTTPGNWNSNAVPVGEEGIGINNGGTAQITSAATAGPVMVAHGSGNIGTLEIGASGSLSATYVHTGGDGSTGNLRLYSGGTLTTGQMSYVGYSSGGVGIASIDGSGSVWNAGSQLYLGLWGGNGTMTVSNGGTFNGNILVGALTSTGVLNIGNGGAAGNITGWVSGDGNAVNSRVNFNHNETAYVFASDITGNLSVTISSGNTTLSSTGNTYTNGTSINGGTLRIASASNIGTGSIIFGGGTLDITGSNVSISNAITLNAAGGTVNNANAVTLSGVISGAGALTKTGAGILTLSNTNTYNGNTIINAGTLRVGSAANMGAGNIAFGGGTLDITGSNISISKSITLNTGGGTINNANTLTLSGPISGGAALTKTGAGTLILTGSNSYTGGTHINGGTVEVANHTVLGLIGDISFNGGTLAVTSNVPFSRNLIMNAGGGTVLNQQPLSMFGVISGVGSFTKAGTQVMVLGNTNTYEGGTVVNGGELRVSTDVNLGASTGALTFSNLAVLSALDTFNMNRTTTLNGLGGDFRVATGRILTQSGKISGSGALETSGFGLLILSGLNDYSGGTNLYGDIQISADTNLGTGNLLMAYEGALHTTATFSMSRAITMGEDGGIFNVGTGTTLTLAGVIGGEGSLTKRGAGTLLLSGVNSYEDDTVIEAGILEVSSDANLGDADAGLTFDGGTLKTTATFSTSRYTWLNSGGGTFDVAAGTTLTHGGYVGGSGDLTKTGAGTLVLTEENDNYGDVYLKGGVVQISELSNLGSLFTDLIFDGGTLKITGATNKVLIRDIYLDPDGGTMDIEGGSVFYNGLMNGGGHFTKTGAGLLEMMSDNYYSGNTIINGGAIAITRNSQLGAISGDLVFGGGTLNIYGDITISRTTALNAGGGTLYVEHGNIFTHSGDIGGTGALTKTGVGILILSGTNTYEGGTAMNGGTVLVTSNANLGNSTGILSFNGGLLQVSSSFTMDRDTTLGASGGMFHIDPAVTLTQQGDISGDGVLTKSGMGGLVLSGTNTYKGGTILSGGMLWVSADENLGDSEGVLTFRGGNLEATEDFSMDRDIVMGFGDGALFGLEGSVYNNTLTLNGVISGLGYIQVRGGVVVLTGDNTYSGGTLVSGGTLKISSDANLGDASMGFTLNKGELHTTATFTSNRAIYVGDNGAKITVDPATTLTVSNSIQNASLGSNHLTKDGTGTLNLTYANTYTGGTTVEAGTLLANNTTGSATGTGAVQVKSGAKIGGSGYITGTVTVADGGTIAPGNSAGTLTVGELVLNNTSYLDFELGTSSDLIEVVANLNSTSSSGNLTLDGILNIEAETGFGEGSYTLINYDGALVANNTLTFGNRPAGYTLEVKVDTTTKQVTLGVSTDGLQFWDGTDTVSDSTVDGGSGTWNNSSTNWTSSTGTVNDQWRGKTAVFSGATGGTVSITENVNVQGLQFATDGYVLADGGGDIIISNAVNEFVVGTGVTATIDTAITGNGGLLKNGAGTLILQGLNTYTGSAAAWNGTEVQAGTLIVRGSGASISHSTKDFIIGIASVLVDNGADVTVKGLAVNGTTATPAILTVDGTGSTWTGGYTTIGSTGVGEVNVQNRATMSVGSLLLGDSASTGFGKVTVDGEYTIFTGQITTLGGAGKGEIYVQNGASMTLTSLIFGRDTGSEGKLTVTGAGTSFQGGYTEMGIGGKGEIIVSAGAEFTLTNMAIIGKNAGVTGKITLTGADTTGSLQVFHLGSAGSGELNVLAGAVLNSTGTSFIGYSTGTGTATVSGADSKWQTSSIVNLGGNGTLQIQNGGVVNAYRVDMYGNSQLLIDGANSKLIHSNAFYTYSSSSADITISNGGQMSVVEEAIFYGDGTGTMTIKGANSKFTVTDAFANQGGLDSLKLEDGGQLISGKVNVFSNSSELDVTITGANSKWDHTASLGLLSNSTLTITNGGQLVTDIFLHQSSGDVLVSGANSLIQVGRGTTGSISALQFGDFQLAAAMTVSAGAQVKSGRFYSTGSNKNITITGAGSKMTTNGETIIGATNSITVANGGAVQVDDGVNVAAGVLYLRDGGSVGTLNIGAPVSQTAVAPGIVNSPVSSTFSGGGPAVVNFNHTSSSYSFDSQLRNNLRVNHYAGTTRLTASNYYTGGTFIYGGLMEFTDQSHFGTQKITLDGGGLRWLTSNTFDISPYLNALATNGGVFDTNDNAVVFSTALTGAGGLTKIGAGTLELQGTDNYTGDTFVKGGKLIINGTLTSSDMFLSGGGALGGRGVLGNVTVNAGGVLAPGNSPGVITFASLKLNPGSILEFELGAPGKQLSSDRIEVLGDLTLGGLLNIIDGGGFGLGTYRLINYGGNLTNNGLTINEIPAGVNPGDLLISATTSGQVNLVYAHRPETVPGFVAGRQYWDGGFNRANGIVNGGDGIWSVDTNWTNVQGLINGKWAGQTAVFAGQRGTVTLGSDIPFEKLIFDVSGYRIVSPLGYKLQAPGNATVQVNRGRATIAAPMTVNGTLHKTGGGLLDLRAPVTAGATLIQGGTLAVNSVLHSPYVNVSHGATLMGNGLIIGNVFNSGTVAPGNSIGTLAIEGNYTQRNNGTLQIEIGSLNHHDMLIVSGTAKLAGTLEIASLGYNAAYGDQVPFLIAGNIEGKFNEITMPNPDRFRGRFMDQSGVGVLLVAPTSYTLVARNDNQTNVARALDEWIGIEEGDIGDVTLALDLLRADQYGQAFDAIAPTYYEAALSTGIELAQSHQQLIHQYLNARRLADRVANVPVIPAAQTVSAKGGKGSKVVEPVAAAPTESDLRWSAWTQASGLFSSGGMSLAPNEDFESGTYIVGADYLVSENVAVGLFASYQEGWGDYAHAGDIDVESTRFGGYLTYDSNAGFYANAVIGGGQTGFDVQRPINWSTLSRTADSEPDGWEFFTGISLGQDIEKGNWTFGPQVTVQYSKLELGEFNETGANTLNLRVHDANSESLRSYLGGRVAYIHKVSDKLTIIPELRAFWQHEFLGGDSFSSSLDSGFGGRFNYKTKGADKDSVLLGAGLGFLIGERVYMNLYYNTDLGRNGDENHTISINATVKF